MLLKAITLFLFSASFASAEVCWSAFDRPGCFVISEVVKELQSVGYKFVQEDGFVKLDVRTRVSGTTALQPSFETDFSLRVTNAHEVLTVEGLLAREAELMKLREYILETLLQIGCNTGATENYGLNGFQRFVSSGGVLIYRISVSSGELFVPKRALASRNYQPLLLSEVTITSCEAP